jgi:hypothetical protein
MKPKSLSSTTGQYTISAKSSDAASLGDISSLYEMIKGMILRKQT